MFDEVDIVQAIGCSIIKYPITVNNVTRDLKQKTINHDFKKNADVRLESFKDGFVSLPTYCYGIRNANINGTLTVEPTAVPSKMSDCSQNTSKVH